MNPARASVAITAARDGRVCIDGACCVAGGWSELLAACDALARGDKAALLVTPNVDQVLNLRTDAAWRRVFHAADLRVCEGAPLLLLARAVGACPPERMTGADLLPRLTRHVGERGGTVVILGGGPGAAHAAAERLRESTAATVHSLEVPVLSGPDDPRGRSAVDRLVELRPDVVFVCFGSPKQEFWVERWRAELPPALYCGVGAAVDFAAGRKRRAPAVLRRLGMEWLWRLVTEPARLWQRYLIKGPAILLVAATSLRAMGRGKGRR